MTAPSSAALNGVSLPLDLGAYIAQDSLLFGVQHRWDIGGTSAIIAIKDSIEAPAALALLNHIFRDSVSISDGYSINYSSPVTDSVRVVVEYDSLISNAISGVNHSYVGYTVTLPATGAVTLSQAKLAAFPKEGVIKVLIVAERMRTIRADPRQYLLRSASAVSTYLTLKP